MELWIPITLAAAFLQNLRSALQKHVKDRLTTAGASYTRFLYAVPFALLYLASISQITDSPVPNINADFVVYCLVGGTAQIVGTALLVSLFSLRNFAVGTTYSKTEAIQTAVFGIVILGDSISALAASAILISLIGVLTLSVGKSAVTSKSLVMAWTERPALMGVGSGACFAISAVCYRAASLSLGEANNFLIQAALTLACVTTAQTLGMGIYLACREPGQLAKVLRSWRVTMWIGLCGMLASACWFTAMTIQNAAYVRALGQVELIFTFIASMCVFQERSNKLEVAGIMLVVIGLLLLVIS